MVRKIRKRDGRIVPFEQEKITNAIFKAAQAVGGTDRERAKELSDEVTIIFISHNLENLKYCNRVIEVINGELIES